VAPVAIPLVSRKKRGSHNSVVSVAETDLAYFGSRAFRDVVKLIGESLPPSRVGRPRRYALPLLVAAHYLHQDETAESALQALQLKRAEVITAISRSCGWSDGLAADSPIPSVQALKRFLAKIRHCSEDIASAVHEVAREDAVEKAKILGLPDNSEGSLLLPNKAACLIADGSFWSAASSHLPKSTFVDKQTGEIRNRRVDPDAHYHSPYDEKNTRSREKTSEADEKYAGPGYKFVVSLLSSNTFSNERIVLDVLPLLKQVDDRNSEPDLLFKSASWIKKELPEIDGLIYDKAIRGVNVNRVWELGYTPIIPLFENKKPVLMRRMKRGKVQFDVYADGSPALQTAPGVFRKIKPLSLKFRRHKRDAKLVPYGRYMITAEIDCDPRLHGHVFDIRLDKSASGVPLGEYLRAVDPTSHEFLELYHARPEIESLFNNMKGTAQERRRRCRHYGYRLNWLDRINQMLRRNQMALMNFQKRSGLSPG